jgi:hypothetical protein
MQCRIVVHTTEVHKSASIQSTSTLVLVGEQRAHYNAEVMIQNF